ncbi:MAG TPA: GntR family transcriptional regulator [Symbiobacteriaceae bacterium]|nr:GntR family transcriptional regulator [Symbiobacteriaceae bacterium]
MLLNISPANPEPMYQQIMQQLRRKIVQGELEPGSALPSVRQLAADLTVSVITVRRAYDELEREGLLYTRQGMGNFVARLDARSMSDQAEAEVRRAAAALVARARELGVSAARVQALLADVLREEEHDGQQAD